MTHPLEEVWRLKVPRLSRLHATATAAWSLGIVKARAQDGHHEDM
jgi:hypothetical protein